MRLCKGGIPLWPYHRQRMREAAQQLGFELTDVLAQWPIFMRHLLVRLQGHDQAAIKLIVTRGVGPRGYKASDDSHLTWCVRVYPYRRPVVAAYRLRLCDYPLSRQPVLAGLKHLNRLDQVLARSEWHDEYNEGLMANIDGDWVEGTMSNLYWIKAGQIHTPDLSQEGVNGVVRRWLGDHYSLRISPCPLAELMTADEVFLSNSLMGIMPVERIAQKTYAPSMITARIQAHLASLFS